ncbi:MAG: YkgJ family cysteine cluster protein [Sulfuriferula sp.]
MQQPDISDFPFPQSPVVPQLVEGEKTIQFQCRKGIKCWNACCSNIDISLTPYDVLRLKNHLNMSSGDFLVKYTVPYELEPGGIAGIKLKPVDEGTACQFMRPEGCSVYEDRPTSCRYYPIALLSMRRQDETTDRTSYAMVQEAHCLGHNEPRSITVNDYRKEQGVEIYDELGRGWRQLILKKKSAGPTIGKPTDRSLQLFFMACYDLDRFRQFVEHASFREVYDLSDAEMTQILGSEPELMQFGFRLLRQVMFNEPSIALKADAYDKRLSRKTEREAIMDDITAKIPPEAIQHGDPNDKYEIKD